MVRYKPRGDDVRAEERYDNGTSSEMTIPARYMLDEREKPSGNGRNRPQATCMVLGYELVRHEVYAPKKAATRRTPTRILMVCFITVCTSGSERVADFALMPI